MLGRLCFVVLGPLWKNADRLRLAGAFRRSELVEIRVGDLTFGPHGLSVFLPRSKADQTAEGSVVNVAANPHAAFCPVGAVRAWLDRAGIGQGWVFRRISRNDAIGRRGLSAESVRLILKAPARDAGYTAADLARITPAQPARRLHHHPRPGQRA